MAKDTFVPDAFDMIGSDAQKIRKLLRIHPRREIPAKIVSKYQSMHHMMSQFKGGFTRDTLAVLCAMGCKAVRGRLDSRDVLMVDGKDLSTDPDAKQKQDNIDAAKKACADARAAKAEEMAAREAKAKEAAAVGA